MQDFTPFEDSQYISDAPTQLNKNNQCIITDFSGSAFPTENLYVGMRCRRTDLGAIYRLYEDSSNNLVWQLEYKIISTGIMANRAEGDKNGKDITTYVGSVAKNASDATKLIVTDGAGNTQTITMYTVSTQTQAEAGSDNASVMTPKGVDYRLNKDRQLKVYRNVLSIGLTTDASLTMDSIYNAMPNQSVLYVEGSSAISQIFPNGDYYGVIEIVKFGGSRTSVKLISNSHKCYYGEFSAGVFSGWQQLATTDDFAPVIYQRNGYYRGKNLGTIASTADADAFNTAHGLSAGTFDDIFVGDYLTIQDGTYNAVWLVAGIDWDYNKGDTASGHGIMLIPKTPLYNAAMNSSNTTAGGYAGSAMHTSVLPALVTKLQTVLGSHLKKRRVLLSTSISTTIASMAGAGWTGATNNWAWTDAYAVLPSEVEVYGSTVFSSSFYDVGEANQKLPIFNFINPVHYSRWTFWLRAVAGSAYFGLVYRDGHAGADTASNSYGVRPLIYLA